MNTSLSSAVNPWVEILDTILLIHIKNLGPQLEKIFCLIPVMLIYKHKNSNTKCTFCLIF